MKNYRDPSLRIDTDYSPAAKKQFLALNILTAVLFVLAGFNFFEALYIFCNLVGSIVSGCAHMALFELKRVFPIMFLLFATISPLVYAHKLCKPRSEDWLRKSALRHGIAYCAIALVGIVYVIVGIATSLYHGLVEGYPTTLFPLDMFIGYLLIGLFGILLIVNCKKIKTEIPFVAWKSNAAINIFGMLLLFEALFGFVAVIFSFFVCDWAHGHIPFIIVLDLAFLAPFLMFCFYKFGYCRLKREYRDAYALRTSVWFLVGNVVLFVVYIIVFSNDLQAPNDACFGILPVEYTASFNAFTYLYGLGLIVPPLWAFIRALIRVKKAK